MKHENTFLHDSAIIADNVIIGKECKICEGVRISEFNTLGDRVEIGDYTGLSSHIHFYNDCRIGKFSAIGANSTIAGPMHHIELISLSNRILYGHGFEPFRNYTIIGNDVWIGANVTIAANVKIGDGAVIGANSYVNKDIPPYSIVYGTPAKMGRYRFSQEIIDELIELQWWDIPNVVNMIIPVDVQEAIEFLKEKKSS